ncbi:NAD(P)/FAD-dependent oxidoreductase [Flagellimonas meridianipacifica]|uniref:D-amino-acid dehydrogenase n=1 Tax=Flagellimonas meridianipacifica TaxID=1080225 RepID=A0A2T0M925_9FLAO|nr:FAD-dependent oxidoreductase [Allomuricauda pacifica]PRX53932.1 D-amino-acid dehydrogenase [Allomuricauda pacifica]
MGNDTVHIIGGGIIGLCAAWYLKKEGYAVTVIDKGDLKEGTSFGNAGMIVPSHFVPMANPGVVAQGLKWMLNSKSPFYIRPRLNQDLVQWLWHFYRSSNHQHVKQAMPILYELNERSKDLYQELSSLENFDFSFEEKGLLMLYKSEKQAEKEAKTAEQAKKIGLEAEILDSKELGKLEPNMDLDVLGGLYFPGDAHLYSNKLMFQLVGVLKQKGVHFLTNTSVSDFSFKGSQIEALISENGDTIPVKNVVVASGSWTATLLKKANIKIYIQDGKGYSITLEKPKTRPQIPTILSEAKVAVIPMGDDLRIGGTLEMSGISPQINTKRIQGIKESIPRYYKNIELPFTDDKDIWKGYRPCTPDGMPYIGKSEALSNLYVGTGHGMMGLSLGAITGKLLSEVIMQKKPSMDLFAFRLDRF